MRSDKGSGKLYLYGYTDICDLGMAVVTAGSNAHVALAGKRQGGAHLTQRD